MCGDRRYVGYLCTFDFAVMNLKTALKKVYLKNKVIN